MQSDNTPRTEAGLPVLSTLERVIGAATRAGIQIGREQARDRAVAFLVDWSRELDEDTTHTARSVLDEAAGEMELWYGD
jgi:hypothetical protein